MPLLCSYTSQDLHTCCHPILLMMLPHATPTQLPTPKAHTAGAAKPAEKTPQPPPEDSHTNAAASPHCRSTPMMFQHPTLTSYTPTPDPHLLHVCYTPIPSPAPAKTHTYHGCSLAGKKHWPVISENLPRPKCDCSWNQCWIYEEASECWDLHLKWLDDAHEEAWKPGIMVELQKLMSLVNDSPIHSSSSEDFAAFLDAELNSTFDISPDLDDEVEDKGEDDEDDSKPKIERS
ncbi:unnamed protein product [Camellia sinensis]